MAKAISTQGLSRIYRSYKKSEGVLASLKGFWDRQYIERLALRPTTLEIEPGTIVGLVGANGAGKTTLLKLLSGLIYPTSGNASVLGFTPWDRKPEFLRQISLLLGQKNQLWWDLPAIDSFSLLTQIYELEPKQARDRVQFLAELLGCKEQLQIQLRRLSLGERMKMELVGSLLHQPRLLFLDEPTIGLDVVAQSTIRSFLSEYVELEKPTIILTSHYMDDIAELAHRLLLIGEGQIVYDGTVEEFTSTASQLQKVFVRFKAPLKQDLLLETRTVAKMGESVVELDVNPHEVPVFIERANAVGSIQELKIEQTEFEDVIRQFMEKEFKLREVGHSEQSRISV